MPVGSSSAKAYPPKGKALDIDDNDGHEMIRQDSHTTVGGHDRDGLDESDGEIEGLLRPALSLALDSPPLDSAAVSNGRRPSASSLRPRSSRWKTRLRRGVGRMGMDDMSRPEQKVFIREMLTQVRSILLVLQLSPS